MKNELQKADSSSSLGHEQGQTAPAAQYTNTNANAVMTLSARIPGRGLLEILQILKIRTTRIAIRLVFKRGLGLAGPTANRQDTSDYLDNAGQEKLGFHTFLTFSVPVYGTMLLQTILERFLPAGRQLWRCCQL